MNRHACNVAAILLGVGYYTVLLAGIVYAIAVIAVFVSCVLLAFAVLGLWRWAGRGRR